MGYALDHLSESQLSDIARSLFKVKSEEQGKGELHGLCPIHGEENPSFSYNYQKDIFFCLSCNAKGDIIDLWCQVNGHSDKKEGFKKFIAIYGIDDQSGSRSTGSQQPPSKKNKEKKKEPPKIIPEDIFQDMPPLPESWIDRLTETRGWSRDIIKELDLRQQTYYLDKKSGKIKKFNGKPQRIAIPVRDDAGKKLLNLRLYKPDAKVNKIISWGKGYGGSRLYPSPANLKPDLPIFLLEGESDTNCALSQGLNAITQTSKLTKWPKEHSKHFKGRDVIICYDADLPGVKYATHAAESLTGIAKSIRMIEWPDYMGLQEDGNWPKKGGQDLTDFFIKHKKTIDDWNELVGQAQTYQPHSKEETADDTKPSDFFEFNGKTNRWSFRPRYLADRILQDLPLMYDPETGLLYKWGGKYWEDFFEESIKKRCLQYLGYESTTSRANDATSQAVILGTIPNGRKVNEHPDLICINNGMLNLASLDKLKKHDKDYYCTYQLDVDFNPDSDKICSRWIEFLEETIQTEGPIKQLQEFFGYCLTRDTKFAKSLFAIGPGADGKSIMLKILRKMCGPQNCSAVSFRDMEDQFYRSAIYNKMLNISTEVGSKALESQYFKAIVTGDPIMAAFKNKTPFEFLPCCKLAFAANKLPRVLDNSDGFFRRVLPVKFKRQFFGKNRDNSLEDKLTAELSEIFEWSLVGLHRLWQQDGFTDSGETDDFLMGYKRLNNPVLCFVEDVCEIGDSDEHLAKKDSLYKKYKNYCSRRGYTQMHYQNFFRELKTAVSSLKDYRPRIAGKREQCVKGIMVTDTQGLTESEE